ncbi:MAG: GNAT family N-acetyltransferase [Gaiellaceae bacterium]|nr:GNAT family N-acetyltransferase [Gaiellaceae bacterium]
MLLRIPEPYDFALSTARFRDYGPDRATCWHEGGLHRVVGGQEVRIEPGPGGVRIEPAPAGAAEHVARLLGLPFDLAAFRAWAHRDPVLSRLVELLAGFRPTLSPDPFEALVTAITTQQISLRAAAAIRARFVERYGERHEVAWAFPKRERVARLRPRDLVALGFSARKAEYLIGLARSELDLEALGGLPDEEVLAAVTGVRGLGRWTADWFLARHLARPRAWPAGDLGLRKAVSRLYAEGRVLTTEEVRAIGGALRPLREPDGSVPARLVEDGRVTIRPGAPGDLDAVEELWRRSAEEVPLRSSEDAGDRERERTEIADILASGISFVVERDGGGLLGVALARPRSPRRVTLTGLYVTTEARGSCVVSALLREVARAAAALGAEVVDLEIAASNAHARTLYARWGFREAAITMVGEVATLEALLGREEAVSFGSIHVQTDDLTTVETAVRQFVPRLPGGSRGSIVAPPRSGWIAVYDDVCDRDPEMLRRLAKELADRMGAVVISLGVERDEVVRMVCHESGRVVDEYLSVPQYYGPLPPGDVVGLQANPRVVSRLTGADPEAIRRIARTAGSPAELPPARELLAELSAAMGIEGAGHGWADAPEIPGAIRIARA